MRGLQIRNRFLLLNLVLISLLGCGQGNDELSGKSLFGDTNLPIFKMEGDGQTQGRGRMFAPLTLQIREPQSGVAIDGVPVTLKQVTNTDAVISTTSALTDSDGRIHFTVRAPTLYNQTVRIEARVETSNAVNTFELYSVSDRPTTIEWETEPPASHTASAVQPIDTFKVRVKDAFGDVIDTNSADSIVVSVSSGAGTVTGTTSAQLASGISTFSNVIYTRAESMIVRATHPGTGIFVEKRILMNHGPAHHLTFTQPPPNTVAGEPILSTVTIHDFAENIVVSGPDSDRVITLSQISGTGALLGTLTKTAVEGVAQFAASSNVRNQVTGVKGIRASKPDTTGSSGTAAMTLDSVPFTILPDAPTYLEWTAPTLVLAGFCEPFVVTIYDQYANRSPAVSNRTLNFTGTGLGSFHTASDCDAGTALSSFVMPAGQDQATLYYRATSAPQTLSIVVSDALSQWAADAASVMVDVSTPVSITIAGPSTLRAGVCSSVMTMVVRDTYTNPSGVLSLTTINLTGAQGTFHTASNCSAGSAITDLVYNVGEHTKTFYFKDLRAETFTIAGTDAAVGLATGTRSMRVDPDKLDLESSPLLRTGDCNLMTITARDAASQPGPVHANVTIDLSGFAPTGNFYAGADATCSGATLSSVTLPSGQNTIAVRFRDPQHRSLTLGVADQANYYTADTLAVQTGPIKMIVTGPASQRAGDCGLFQATTQNVGSVAAGVLQSTQFNLTQGAALGQFFDASDNLCLGIPITSLTFSTGDSVKGFRYKDTTAQTMTVRVDDNAGWIDFGSVASVTGPRFLNWAGASSLTANVCEPFVLNAMDGAGNVSGVLTTTLINLTDSATPGEFYLGADTTCSGATLTSTTFAVGQGTVALRYRDTTAAPRALLATDSGTVLDSGNHPLTVGPSELRITGPNKIYASQCGLYSVDTYDANNTLSAVIQAETVNLADGAGTGNFYDSADATCSGATISTLAYTIGQSSRSFRYKDPKGEGVTLNASDAGAILTQSNYGVLVGPDRMSLTGATPIRSGDCTLFTFVTRDTQTNLTNVFVNTNIALSGNSGGSFYAAADTTCAGATITQVAVPNGSGGGSFRYRNPSSESVTLVVDDQAAQLSSANLPVVIGPRSLDLAGPAQLRAQECGLYSVTSRNFASAASNVLLNTTVLLDDGAASGDFYLSSDTTCTGVVQASLVLASGTSVTSVRYRNPKSEAITLGAMDQAALLDSDTLAVGIGPDRINVTGTAAIRADDCIVYTAQLQDSLPLASGAINAVTVSLTDATAAGQFFDISDTTCAGATISSLNYAVSEHTKTFRYRNPKAEAVTLSVAETTLGGITTGALNLNVGPRTINVTGASQFRSGECVPVTLTYRDAQSTAAGVLAARTMMLSDGAASGDFYADAACTPAAIASVATPAATSTQTVYYKNPVAEAMTFTVSDSLTELIAGTLNVTAGPDRFDMTGATPIRAGDCVPYTITSRDTLNALKPVLVNTTVNVSDGVGSGLFYAAADTACAGGAVTTAPLLSGASTQTVYYKNLTAESATLSAADAAASLTTSSLSIVVGPRVLIVTGAAQSRANECLLFTVTSRDGNSTAANVLSNTTVNIDDGAGTGSFFASADTTCVGGAITSVVVTSGTNSQTFRYKNAKAESVVLSGADNASLLITGTLNHDIGPNHYDLTGIQNVRANECALYTITTRDALPVAANALANLAVNQLVDGTATGEFYATTDTTCAGAAITSVQVNSGSSSAQFRWRDSVGEAVTLSVDDGAGGLTAGTLAVGVGPDRLTLTGATPIRAGDCSAYTVTAQDAAATARNVISSTTINLTLSAGNGVFFSDVGCTAVITSVVMASGTSTSGFYFKNDTTQSQTLTVADNSGYLNGSNLAVVAGPRSYQITGPTPVRAGDCSLYTVTSKDQAGVTAVAIANLVINQFVDGVATGTFYAAADTTCAGAAATSVQIDLGSSSTTFRWRDTKAESVTLSVDDGAAAGSLDAGTKAVVVGPDRLILTGASPIRSGDCSAYTITSRDADLNPTNVLSATTVNLTRTGASGVFYSDAGCTAVITSTVMTSTSTATVYYKNAVAESHTLTATDNAASYLTASNLNIVTGPQYYDVTGPTPLRAGECGLYTVTTKDQAGTAANALSNLTINQLVDSTATGEFFAVADTTCAGAAITSIQVNSGSSSTQFRWRDTKAEVVTLSVDDGAAAGSLDAGTKGVTVGPNRITIAGSSPIRASDCGLYTITIRDVDGTASNVLSNTTVNLSGAGTGAFYDAADTTCVGATITSRTILTGASSATYRYRSPDGQSVTLNADDAVAYLAGGTLPVIVGPDHILISGATPIRSGDCTAYTVSSRDVTGTAKNVLSNTTVNLTSSHAGGAFFSDVGCGTGITSTVITSGTSSSGVYYKNSTAIVQTLTGTDNAAYLTAGTLSVTTGPRFYQLTGTTPILAGTCQLYTITTKDHAAVTSNALANLTVNQLVDGTATGDFYAAADTACVGAVITSVQVSSGTSSIPFRWKNPVAESVTLSVDDGAAASSLDAGTLAVVVGPDRLTIAGATPVRSGDCTAFTLTSRDVNATAQNVLTNTTVNLTSNSGSGGFYSNAGCSSSITSGVITAGTNITTVYYKNDAAIVQTLTAADNAAALSSGTVSVTTGPRDYQLTGLTQIRANECGLYTITTRDVVPAAANALSNLTVNQLVDGTATGDFYAAADTTCVGGAITSVQVNSGTSSVQFRWKNTVGESVTLSVDDGAAASSLNAGTLAVGVGPDRIILSGATPIRSGDCTAYTVTAKDAASNTKNVVSNTTVNLSLSGGSGVFYSDVGCGTGTSTVVVASGTSAATFYFKNNVAESQTLTIADNAAYLTGSNLAVVSGPRYFDVTGTSPVRAGDCTLYTITTKDQAGSAKNALANLTVNQLVDSVTTGNFYAAADTTCASATVSSVQVDSGTSSTTFRWRDTKAESVTLSADDGAAAGSLDAGTKGVVVGPDRLIFTGATPIRAGDCTAYTITSRDVDLNATNVLSATTVNLSQTGSGVFYSDVGCTAVITSKVMTAASTATVYYKDDTGEAATLTIADNAAYLTGSNLAVTTGPRYYQLTGSSPIRAGDCSLYTITTKDQAGVTTNALSNLTVNQLVDSVTTGNFYAAADTTCVGGTVASVQVNSGSSSTTFRWRDTKAESVTLSVDDGAAAGSLDAGTLGVVVGPNRITLAGSAQIRAGDCSLYSMTIRDVDGNASNVLSNTTVNLSGAGTGAFYDPADTTCVGGAITSRAILAGANTSSFRYRALDGQSLTFNGDDAVAYLASGTLAVAVGPDHLTVTGASPIRSGDCTAYATTSLDLNAAAKNVLVNTTVNLTSNHGGGAYFSNAGCSSGITAILMTAGTSTATVYYRNNTATTQTLTIADNASAYLASGTVSVVTGPRSYQLTGTTPILAATCQLYTVTTKDQAGATANALANLVVNQLTDGTATGDFYAAADTTCVGAVITSVQVDSGASTITFRWKNPVSESVTLGVDDGAAASSLDAGTLAVAVSPDRLTIAGATPVRSGDCTPLTLTSRDANSTAKNVLSNTTLNLTSDHGGGAYFSDVGCTAGITSKVLSSGTNNTTVYYKNNTATTQTLTVADNVAQLTSGTQSIVTGPRDYQLTGPAQPRAGDCSLYTVTTRDVTPASANALSNLTVNQLVDSSATGDFYDAADTTCTGSVITSVQVTSGTSSVQFRWKDTVGHAVTLSVDDGGSGLNAGTLGVSTGPDRLILSGATPVRSGDCTAYTVTAKDVGLVATNVFVNTTINLSKSGGSGAFYSNVGCSTSTSSVVMSSATSAATFYFKNDVAESQTLTIADNAAYLTGSTLAVTTGPRYYQLTGATPVRAGDCTLYTMTTKDQAGTTANALANLTVNQLVDSVATGNFYAAADTTCVGGTVSSVQVDSGTSSATFRWRDTKAESVTLSVDDGAAGSSLDAGTLGVVVGPDRLVVTGTTGIRSGDCTPYIVYSRDVDGNNSSVLSNTTVNLSKSGGSGVFHSNAGCSAGISNVTINSGSNSATFYFLNSIAETQTLTGTDNAAYLTAGNLAVQTGPKYFQVTGLTPTRANECGLYTVTSRDNAANAANPLSNITVDSLSDGASPGVFYAAADTTCAGSAVTSLSLPTSQTSVDFRWRSATASVNTLTVDDAAGAASTGLDPGTLSVTVGPSQLIITGNNVISELGCGLFTVTAQDAQPLAANVLSNTTVNLTDGAGSGQFYAAADTTCAGGTISNVVIANASSATNFRYMNSTSEVVTLAADDNAVYLTSGTLSVEIGSDRFEITGPAEQRAGECVTFTVNLKDAFGNLRPAVLTSTGTLTDAAAAGVFYDVTDTTCVGSAITTLTFNNGDSTKTFRYRDDTGQAVVLSIDDGAGGRTAATLPLTIGPNRLTIGAIPFPSVSNCTQYQAVSRDVAGAAVNVTTNTTVNLTGMSNGSFYAAADTTCIGAAVTSVLISSGANTGTVYYQNATSELVTFTATDNASYLTAGTYAVEVGADRLAVTGSTPIKSGTCQLYTVTAQNAASAAQNVLANTTINLADAASAGVFYAAADATCVGGAVASVVINSGSSSTTFRYRDDTAEAVTLTASSTSRTNGTLAVTVDPSKLTLSGTAVPFASACTLYTINSRDTANALANVPGNVTVNLGGGSAGAFYTAADTTCAGAAQTSVTLASGTNQVQVRYKNLTSESVTLQVADNAAYLASDTLSVSVAPDRLTLSGTAPIRSGDCAAYSVTARDGNSTVASVFANTTVNLTGAGSGTFYSDAGCSASTTSVVIGTGTNNQAFYFKNNTAESVTLQGAATGMTAGTLAVTSGPRNLLVTGTATIKSSQCSLYTVTTRDPAANAANPLATVTVNLTGAANGAFYAAADSTCSGGTITQVSIGTGVNNITFRYKNPVAETATLSAADNAAALVTGTLAVTTGPEKLTLSATSPAQAGTCNLVTINSQDGAGTNINVGANTQVNLSDGAASGQFYTAADTTCVGGTIANRTILSGSNSVQFRYRNPKAETATLNGDDNAASLTSGTFSFTTTPSRLAITGSTSINTGACTLYTVTSQDEVPAAANVPANTTVSLADAASLGRLYAAADTSCSGAEITSAVIASGSSSVQFNYIDDSPESITLTASSAGLTSGTRNVTVNDNCLVNNYLVELRVSGSTVTAVTAGQAFDVRVTARDVGNTTRACFSRAVNLTWTMNASAGTADCGAPTATAIAPSETSLTFVSGVATTTSTAAKLFAKQANANVQVSDGSVTSQSGNINVTSDTTCRVRLVDASAGAGATVTALSLDLNVNGSTTNSEKIIYVAGFDAYGNYTADETAVWTGDATVTPLVQTTTATDDTARVIGYRIGSGTLTADWSGGGGSKTASASVTVSSTNGIGTITSATTDLSAANLIASNTTAAVFAWEVTSDAVTAWRTAGTQSWWSEAFSASRGARKDFPAKAFLIANSSGLSVVDATSGRLWMRFDLGAGNAIDSALGSIQSVAALNGRIFVAMRSGASTGGLIVIDFAADQILRYTTSGEYSWGSTIASRNSAQSWSLASGTKVLSQNAVYTLSAKRIGAVDYVLMGVGTGTNLYQNSAGSISIYHRTLSNAVIATAIGSTALYFAEATVGVHRADVSLPLAANFSEARTYTGSTPGEIQSFGVNSLSVGAGTSAAQGGENTLLVAHDQGLSVIQEHGTAGSSQSRTYGSLGSGQTPFSGVLDLDGVAGSMTVPTNGSTLGPLQTNPVTIEMRFRPDAVISTGQSPMLFQRGNGNSSMALGFSNGNLVCSYIDASGATTTATSAASSWSAATWYHAACVINSAGVTLWWNGGSRVISGATLTGEVVQNAGAVLGATVGSTDYFDGAIDELRISSVARYSAATFTVPASAHASDANTTYLYHFDEGSGAVASYSDTSAQQNGVLSGNARFVTPVFAGTSEKVQAIVGVLSGGALTASLVTNGSGAAWSELTSCQTSSAAIGSSATSVNGVGISVYQMDSATNYDFLIGISGGGYRLQRR